MFMLLSVFRDNLYKYFLIFCYIFRYDDHTDEARHGSALTAEDLKMVSSLKKKIEEKKKKTNSLPCHNAITLSSTSKLIMITM